MKGLSKTEWLTLGVGAIAVIGFGAYIYLGQASGTPGSIYQSLQQKSMKEVAQNGDIVSVHYTGKLENGTVFDTSLERGQPIQFTLGAAQVIRGWDEGILGMKVGEKKQLIISPDKAYGPAGVKNPQTGEVIIPANATLIFDVELVAVQ